ncbi:phage tail protein I [Vreelandella populi]|uniref:Phage tail protein I n=1 Tax=Vreelandella populi TaxID=2498858 RepID=A0A3S0WN17_9GAMM|nr:phage tail protein I [Halomonas populi]RUR46204.1 phage tail protein I [Halomonas populi]
MTDLMPPNRTALERRVAASHPLDLPVPLRTLWNPATCPVEFLPFLAWAFSVDQWHETWPESVKRRVIANSAELHRIKGTRPAVELAMETLGVSVELTEWFEATPNLPRGTFSAVLYVNENLTPEAPALLSDTLYTQLRRAIDNAKNTRSHYEFKVGARLTAGIGAASALKSAAVRRDTANAVTPPLTAQSHLVATAVQKTAAVTRRHATAALDANLSPTPLAIACTYSATAVARCTMESQQ